MAEHSDGGCGGGGSGRKREQGGGGETELPVSLPLVCAVCALGGELQSLGR
jgi:hypothetical protein